MIEGMVDGMRSVDRELFSGIYVDRLYINVGGNRILRDVVGIYNRVCDWILSKYGRGRLGLFVEWVSGEGGGIGEWEVKLLEGERICIIGEVMRLRYRGSSCVEFWVCNKVLGGRDMVWVYIGNTNERGIYGKLCRELQYNRVVSEVVRVGGLVHPLSMGIRELEVMIKDGLVYGVIKELGDGDRVFNPEGEINLKDELSSKYYSYVNGIKQ